MIFVCTNSFDGDANAFLSVLRRSGVPYYRFDADNFPRKVKVTIEEKGTEASITIFNRGRLSRISDVRTVWFRATSPPNPGSIGLDTELRGNDRNVAFNESVEALTAIWSELDALWINNPISAQLASNKVRQLKLAREVGLEMPRTIVTNDPAKAMAFCKELEGRVIVKQMARNLLTRGGRRYGVNTSMVSARILDRISNVQYAPVLFQEHVEKKLDVRTTIVDSDVFSAEIHSQTLPITRVDWRRAPHKVRVAKHELPNDIREALLRLMRKLELHFTALDLILTRDDRYVLLDVNPSGHWRWVERFTKLPITSSLMRLLTKLESAK